MKKLSLIIFYLLVFSCSKDPNSFVEHVNGYWEIEQVIFIDGTKKEYKYNDTVDYINLNDSLVGFRKKLKPSINSKYVTSKDAEGLTAKIENDSLHLYYKTPYATWKETVLMANETTLKVVNDKKTVYLYKRYKPLQLDIE